MTSLATAIDEPTTSEQRPSGGAKKPGRSARRDDRPVWVRPAVAALGLLSLALYTWNLSRNGMANTYYAAAVKSGTVSWKAFFFGSLDPGSFITVDKPPAAFWLQALSARAFGFSSWSILLPEALAGVASVLVLYRIVARWAGHAAGLLAGLALALTPVAVLMFRFNNPDALLTLLLLLAAWSTWAAVETGRTRHLLVAGALVGLAFDTKMLQAMLVLPALGLVYLWAGPPKLGRRIGQLLAGGLALVASGGWWVAIVALWPAASRPYIGSTSDNSILSLIFGYNGLSRLFGSGGGGSRGGGSSFGGAAGWLRLFDTELGGQIAWLLPMAGAGLLAGLWATRRDVRTDPGRAGYILWGGWAVVTAAVFSKAQGTFHSYYAVALAPAIAALAAAGAVDLWRIGRLRRVWSWLLPAAVAASATTAVVLLGRSSRYETWLTPTVIALAAVAVLGLLAAPWVRHRAVLAVAAVAATAGLLAGPTAYSLTTIHTGITGSLPSAGPAVSGGAGGFPGAAGAFGSGEARTKALEALFGGRSPGGSAFRGGSAFPGGGAFGGGGGFGGADTGPGTDKALVSYLEAHRNGAEYLVAVQGAGSAEGIILATGAPVMAMGGFIGSDPAPTVAELQKLVGSGKLRYVLLDSGGGGAGRGNSSVTNWVTSHGKAVSVAGSTGSATLYLVTP